MSVSVGKTWLDVGHSKSLPIAKLVLDVTVDEQGKRADEQQHVDEAHDE